LTIRIAQTDSSGRKSPLTPKTSGDKRVVVKTVQICTKCGFSPVRIIQARNRCPKCKVGILVKKNLLTNDIESLKIFMVTYAILQRLRASGRGKCLKCGRPFDIGDLVVSRKHGRTHPKHKACYDATVIG